MPDAGLTDGVTEYDAAFHDTYVRQQVVAQVTASTRPTNIEGRLIHESDSDIIQMGTGSGSTWLPICGPLTSYTPTFTNCTSAAGTFRYQHIGQKLLLLTGSFTGGTATGAAVIALTLPLSLTSVSGLQVVSARYGANIVFAYVDSSATTLTITKTAGGASFAGADSLNTINYSAVIAYA